MLILLIRSECNPIQLSLVSVFYKFSSKPKSYRFALVVIAYCVIHVEGCCVWRDIVELNYKQTAQGLSNKVLIFLGLFGFLVAFDIKWVR